MPVDGLTNVISIELNLVIEMRVLVIHLVTVRVQRNFAHTKTAVLSWYVQNFIVLSSIFFKWSPSQLQMNLEFNQ